MSSAPHATDRPIQMTGIWLFGSLSLVLVIGKLIGFWGGSWWRMVLPILSFLVFNGLYIGIGFLYLTVKPVRDQPAEEERAVLRHSSDGAFYGSGFLFTAGLVVNLVSRVEGAAASGRWWLFSGRVSMLMVFGLCAVMSLWLYWSRIGQALGHEEAAER